MSNPVEWANNWEVGLIQGRLTRSIGAIVPNVCDEVSIALPTVIPHGNPGTCDLHHHRQRFERVDVEWIPLSAMDVAEKLVMRGAGRAFVGLPMCNAHFG